MKTKIKKNLNSVNIYENFQVEEILQDTKFQNITYYKQNGSEIIGHPKRVSIDFLKAMSEMEKQAWNEDNHIGFENHRTNEIVQFIRKAKNNWYADVPIKSNVKSNNRLCWGAYSDSKTISNIMRLFFEEVEWFGMINWKLMSWRTPLDDRY